MNIGCLGDVDGRPKVDAKVKVEEEGIAGARSVQAVVVPVHEGGSHQVLLLRRHRQCVAIPRSIWKASKIL